MITELEVEFKGMGEVRDFDFIQQQKNEFGYIYKVDDHFEVFKRKLSAVCIDFKNRVYSETDFKVIYPKSNNFGVWAWTASTIERAEEILKSFEV